MTVEEPKYTCDVCEETISGKHQLFWMRTITVTGEEAASSGTGHETFHKTYHAHHGECMEELWEILR